MNKKRILVAGVGNVFLKDDGFAAEVVKQILAKAPRDGVEVQDFGTGGLKLAYDLMKSYDALILIDTAQRGHPPGTLYVIEPNADDIPADVTEGGPIDPHAADTRTVLRFIKAFGAWPVRLLIVGCEPANVADLDLGLSEPVRAAVGEAVKLVENLGEELLAETSEVHHEHTDRRA
jgi:hydrogenase maturation protease